MRIAVNTRFLLKDKLEGIGWFTYEIFKRVVEAHPEHEYIFLFDRPFDNRFIFSDQVKGKVVYPPARHPILWKWWFDYSVPRALKKEEADLFISPDGFCSLKSEVPALMVIHDLAFEHFPDHVPKQVRKFYQKYTPQYARRADHLITVSEFSKKDIVRQYGIKEDKIDVIYNAVNDLFRPLPRNEKEIIKERFSGGADYFLFVSALQPRKNLIRLLQAFEEFKKNDSSSVKLLVVGSHTWIREEIRRVVDAMKFKDDVMFTGHLGQAELAGVVASALALCYVSFFEGFGIPILEAMQAEVPVITSNVSSMPEVAGNAALLVDPYSIEAIAGAMSRIQKEAPLQRQLIEKGKDQRKKFDWDKSAGKMWKVIEKFIK